MNKSARFSRPLISAMLLVSLMLAASCGVGGDVGGDAADAPFEIPAYGYEFTDPDKLALYSAPYISVHGVEIPNIVESMQAGYVWEELNTPITNFNYFYTIYVLYDKLWLDEVKGYVTGLEETHGFAGAEDELLADYVEDPLGFRVHNIVDAGGKRVFIRMDLIYEQMRKWESLGEGEPKSSLMMTIYAADDVKEGLSCSREDGYGFNPLIYIGHVEEVNKPELTLGEASAPNPVLTAGKGYVTEAAKMEDSDGKGYIRFSMENFSEGDVAAYMREAGELAESGAVTFERTGDDAYDFTFSN